MSRQQLVARLARELASNEENVRYRAFKNLKNALEKSVYNPEEFLRLWSGLYYMYYHSDTMVKQNKLAVEIGQLKIAKFERKDVAETIDPVIEWIRCGLVVLKEHWNQIDYHRMNKFMHLVRILIKQGVRHVRENGFKKTIFTAWNQVFEKILLDDQALERGLILHAVQIYPSIALDIDFGNVVQVFFCFKPIFDMMMFTKNKILRAQIAENLCNRFIDFAVSRLNAEAQEFVKKKIMGYASSTIEGITQAARNVFYGMLDDFERAQNSKVPISRTDEVASLPKIGLKKKKQVKKSNLTIKLKRVKNTKKIKNQKIKDQKGPDQKVANEGDHLTQAKKNISKKKQKSKAIKNGLNATKTKKKKPKKVLKNAIVAQTDDDFEFGFMKKTSQDLDFDPSQFMSNTDSKDDTLFSMLDSDLRKIIQENEDDELPEDFFDLEGLEDDALAELEAMQQPFSETSFEEMQRKLPVYLFMSKKEKRKYFAKFNKDYQKKMKKAIKKKNKLIQKGGKAALKSRKRIKINLGNNTVKTFWKNEKMKNLKSKTQGVKAGPAILKRRKSPATKKSR